MLGLVLPQGKLLNSLRLLGEQWKMWGGDQQLANIRWSVRVRGRPSVEKLGYCSGLVPVESSPGDSAVQASKMSEKFPWRRAGKKVTRLNEQSNAVRGGGC